MKRFAVFDIDGTLIRWQLYHAVADNLANKGFFGVQAQQELKAQRLKWKNREHDQAYKQYERALVRIFDINITRITPAQFKNSVEEVVTKYKNQVYNYTKELLRKLKNDGYFLIAISGSHQEIIELIAKEYGFDDFAGSTYEQKNGLFTGAKNIVALDKKSALDKIISKHQLTLSNSVGVGDTMGDIPILSSVQNPIVFNPENELYKKAKINGWKIVIERKNVIYELEQKDGTYLLAEAN